MEILRITQLSSRGDYIALVTAIFSPNKKNSSPARREICFHFSGSHLARLRFLAFASRRIVAGGCSRVKDPEINVVPAAADNKVRIPFIL